MNSSFLRRSFFLLGLSFFCLFSQAQSENLALMDKSTTALILIDIQAFYFPGGRLALSNSEEAAEQAGKILDWFRREKMPVIHVQHKGGGEIHSLVKPIHGEKLIEKTEINSFKNTDLLEYLQSLGIKYLVLAGMQTHMCLEAATRAASDFGFKCIVIHDACATRDLTFGPQTVKATDVHASTLAALTAYATILSTEEFLNNTF